MIKPGDTYKITNIEDINILIKQTDGLRLSEEQSKKLIDAMQEKELHDCFNCKGCICEEYCKEQDKLDFPEEVKI